MAGASASIGGAISAKSIGRHCSGVLAPSEIAELDTYLAKASKEWEARRVNKKGLSFDEIASALAQTYESKYRDLKTCDADATEEARDSLQRIRKAMASGKPLFADPADPKRRPDVVDMLRATTVGEKCEGALTAREWADLELALGRYWVHVAKTTNERDARATFVFLKAAEKNTAAGWTAKDCTGEAVKDAKTVAARVHDGSTAEAR